MQAESWTIVESAGAGDTKRDLQEGHGAKPGASCCKVPTDRGQRGRVDRWRRGCGTAAANAEAGAFSFFRSVEPVGVRAPKFASGLAACAELSVPLKEVTRNLLEEITRNLVDLGIPSELCKILVDTAFGLGEGAVASWGFVAVLMCGNEAVCD